MSRIDSRVMVHWKARLFDIDEPQFSNVSCGGTKREFGLGVLLSPCILHFFSGLKGIVHKPPSSAKHRFLGKFGSYSTIHTFKNYFVSVFLAISFQFSANKRYPNTP